VTSDALTLAQAAAIAQVHPRTLAEHCASGSLPARDVGTSGRYLGRYRSDAAAVVPDFGVGSVLTAPAADVIPLRRGR